MDPLYQPRALRAAAPLQYNASREGVESYATRKGFDDPRGRDTLAGGDGGEALALCRERRIRHMPVVEGGRLVGIVSDRDLRSSTPALGDPARSEAL